MRPDRDAAVEYAAESQAREQALRAALAEVLNERLFEFESTKEQVAKLRAALDANVVESRGLMLICRICHGKGMNGRLDHAMHSPPCPLSAPTDDTALKTALATARDQGFVEGSTEAINATAREIQSGTLVGGVIGPSLREYGLKSVAAERAYFRALCLGEDAVPASATLDEVKAALREFGLRVGHRVANRPDLRDSRDTVETIVDALLRGKS